MVTLSVKVFCTAIMILVGVAYLSWKILVTSGSGAAGSWEFSFAAAVSSSLRERMLPSLLTMETVASYCLTEPGSGWLPRW